MLHAFSRETWQQPHGVLAIDCAQFAIGEQAQFGDRPGELLSGAAGREVCSEKNLRGRYQDLERSDGAPVRRARQVVVELFRLRDESVRHALLGVARSAVDSS